MRELSKEDVYCNLHGTHPSYGEWQGRQLLQYSEARQVHMAMVLDKEAELEFYNEPPLFTEQEWDAIEEGEAYDFEPSTPFL